MLRFILSTLVVIAAWATLVVFGTLAGWWREPLTSDPDTGAFMAAAKEQIDTEYNGNVAFVLLKNGKAYGEHFRSVGNPVDGDTLFQTASLSKWVSAWGVMSLVDAGKLDLDAPVSKYLTRWELPPSEFDNGEVTVRRLLSHTAGLTDGLGYGGFAPGEKIQPLTESLTKAADASPGKDGKVQVGVQPGEEFNYSGGGYTLLQLLVEEVSGQSFNDYMVANIFKPLGMDRTTYVLEEPVQSNVAVLYDEAGKPATHYRFASLAATSLYTSTNDLTRFIDAQLAGSEDQPIGRKILTPETVQEMRLPHASQMGADIWGLGTMLYAPNNTGGFIIGHDGNNEPAINTAARFDPDSGDGIIILETGNKLLATELAGEWIFWRTGNVDFLMVTMESKDMIRTVLLGWIVIIIFALFLAWRSRRAKKKRPSLA